MTRLVIYLAMSLVLALGAAWLISLPGTVLIDFGSYRMQPPLGIAVFSLLVFIALIIAIWAVIRRILEAPRQLAKKQELKKRQAGVEALSTSIIALQAGEYAKAKSAAKDAMAKLPDNVAAKLLEARSELALGELNNAREHYKQLITSPKTAVAALSGLYHQALGQNRSQSALVFAQKAVAIAPDLEWASNAVFNDLAANGQWTEALAMAENMPNRTKVDKLKKKRKQGVLNAAAALSLEISEPDTALEHALSSMKLIPDFQPAALSAARVYINRGDSKKAAALLRRVWRSTNHPDVATLYAHINPGSSAVERLKRVKTLIENADTNLTGALVLARAAIDAYEWPLARTTLTPFLAHPTQATCLLMASLEEGETGDQGKTREWLSRALTAPKDATWVADGYTSEEWAPISPLTGKLDAFEWKVPMSKSIAPVLDKAADYAAAQPELEPLNAKIIEHDDDLRHTAAL